MPAMYPEQAVSWGAERPAADAPEVFAEARHGAGEPCGTPETCVVQLTTQRSQVLTPATGS